MSPASPRTARHAGRLLGSGPTPAMMRARVWVSRVALRQAQNKLCPTLMGADPAADPQLGAGNSSTRKTRRRKGGFLDRTASHLRSIPGVPGGQRHCQPAVVAGWPAAGRPKAARRATATHTGIIPPKRVRYGMRVLRLADGESRRRLRQVEGWEKRCRWAGTCQHCTSPCRPVAVGED